MRARLLLVSGLIAAGALAMPGTAHAAGTGTVESPASGSLVSSPTQIVVAVTGNTEGTVFNPPGPHAVNVRLANLGNSALPGGSTPKLDYVSGSGPSSGNSKWATTFDPATLAPFSGIPGCNGGYRLHVQVDNGAWTGGTTSFRVAQPPAAATGVTVSPGVGTAQVSWTGSATPDVTGYAIDRQVAGSWTTIGEVGAAATSYTDDAAPGGEVAYRVVAQRGDGLVNGAMVDPCTDPGRDVSKASAPVATTVEAPAPNDDPSEQPSNEPAVPSRPSPTPDDDPTDTGGGDAGGDTGGTGGTGTGGTTGGDTGGTAGDGTGTGDVDGSSQPGAAPTRRAGTRLAPPAAVDTAARPDVDVPAVAGESERYYGDDQEFSEQLDFGSADQVGSEEPTTESRTEVVEVPGATTTVFGQEMDLGKLAAPLAAGMLLFTVGAHLRRWIYAAPVD